MIVAPAPHPAVAADIETAARPLAALDPAEIDRLVADQVAAAVRERRIDDAIRWQRVRLRARTLRRNATTACRG